jgi:hypothetical protein
MAMGAGKLSLCLCLALLQDIAAEAATITPEAGSVLVSRGDGFVPLVGQTQLAAGSRVMVGQGGQASIIYTADCTVRVPSGLWLVQEAVPCAKGTVLVDFTAKMANGSEPEPEPPPPPPSYNGYAIGAITIGAGAVISCLVWWCRHHGHPASP